MEGVSGRDESRDRWARSRPSNRRARSFRSGQRSRPPIDASPRCRSEPVDYRRPPWENRSPTNPLGMSPRSATGASRRPIAWATNRRRFEPDATRRRSGKAGTHRLLRYARAGSHPRYSEVGLILRPLLHHDVPYPGPERRRRRQGKRLSRGKRSNVRSWSYLLKTRQKEGRFKRDVLLFSSGSWCTVRLSRRRQGGERRARR